MWPGPPPSSQEGTRLDVHPFSEPTPSGPVLRDPLPTPPPRSGGQSAAKAKNDRVRSIVLTVLAIVAAALVGILVASLLSGGNDTNNGEAQDPGTSSEVVPTSKTPTSTSETTTTTTTITTTTTPDAPAAPTNAEYESAVREYYSLLPGNVSAAWQRMTPNAQQMGGGEQSYQSFWGEVASVAVTSATAQGASVATGLTFSMKDGRTSNENYVVTLTGQSGQLMIDSFQKIG
jgi:cytoskeletal protein RodZ